MKPSTEDISRYDPFLADPDKLHYKIVCVNCKKPLWEYKVLKRHENQIVSSWSKPIGHGFDFDKKLKECLFCKQRFFHIGKRGGQMYLIHCQNSGITRLI